MNAKALWDRLALADYRHYIHSVRGKTTEEEFVASGEADYKRLIVDDPIIRARIPNSHEAVILEIGCGAGRLLSPMLRDFKTVIGTDISRVMINLAWQRLAAQSNLRLFTTDGRSVPCPKNSVDLAFSYLVFQHIKEYDVIASYFRETCLVLKPGGLFKVLLSRVEYRNMSGWWKGVSFTDEMVRSIPEVFGFTLVKAETTNDQRIWLWLEKK